jgi:hypothetical protein
MKIEVEEERANARKIACAVRKAGVEVRLQHGKASRPVDT